MGDISPIAKWHIVSGGGCWKRQCHRTWQDTSIILKQELMAACNALKSNQGEMAWWPDLMQMLLFCSTLVKKQQLTWKIGTERTNIMSLTQRIMNNESPSNGNYTDKELGNINDVMTWLDVHNDTQHPHAWLALCNGKNMVISSYKIKYYFNKNA